MRLAPRNPTLQPRSASPTLRLPSRHFPLAGVRPLTCRAGRAVRGTARPSLLRAALPLPLAAGRLTASRLHNLQEMQRGPCWSGGVEPAGDEPERDLYKIEAETWLLCIFRPGCGNALVTTRGPPAWVRPPALALLAEAAAGAFPGRRPSHESRLSESQLSQSRLSESRLSESRLSESRLSESQQTKLGLPV